MTFEKRHLATFGGVAATGLLLYFLFRPSPGRGDGKNEGNDAGPAPPAPDGLLADVTIATPNAAWLRLQRGVGGAAGILPNTLPGVLVALTDLDPQLGSELDGASPMYGALAGDPFDPSYLVAMRLVDPRHARAVLTSGDTARFEAVPAPGSHGMTRLAPKPVAGAAPRRFEIAFTDSGFLVLAPKVDDLGRLAPYVTEALPRRKLDQSAVTIDTSRSALSQALAPALARWWKDTRSFLLAQDQRMRAERGRPPDLGDPASIVAALDEVVGRRIAIVGDLDHAHVTLDATDSAVAISATLTPAKEGIARDWVSGMRVGDASPVTALPAGAFVALSSRDSEPERAAQGATFEKGVAAALGSRLERPASLHEVVEASTKARDDTVAIAVRLDDPAGVFARASVRDPVAAQQTVRGLVQLASGEPFKTRFALGSLLSSSEEVAGLGKVDVAKVEAGGKKAVWPTVGAAWTVTEDGHALVLALGRDPIAGLRAGATPVRRLSDDRTLDPITSRIGRDAATVVVAQPFRTAPPLVLAVGRHERDAFVSVDVPDLLLRDALRSLIGL